MTPACRAPAAHQLPLHVQVTARLDELSQAESSAGEVYRIIQQEFPHASPELIHHCAKTLLSQEGL